MGLFTHALLVFLAEHFRIVIESSISVQEIFTLTVIYVFAIYGHWAFPVKNMILIHVHF